MNGRHLVIDLEAINTYPHDSGPLLVTRLRESGMYTLGLLADHLEAQLPVPKPAAPTGLGAVVRDRAGNRWVHADPDDSLPWLAPDGDWAFWADIDAVEVLSEGVTT